MILGAGYTVAADMWSLGYILVVVAMNRITERKLNIEAMEILEHRNVKRDSRAMC